MEEFRANGKLLLTGEYLVLDGARALALPCKKGQKLRVSSTHKDCIQWKSVDVESNMWLNIEFSFDHEKLEITSSNNEEQANWVLTLLQKIQEQYPAKLQRGLVFESQLEFDRDWGLGSSSTFLSNLAQWSEANPYQLLWDTATGSGYDIACATARQPLYYTLENGKPVVENLPLDLPFMDDLFFVHLGLKQSSKTAIEFYNQKRSRKKKIKQAIAQIDEISTLIPSLNTLQQFEELLHEHEEILAELLNMERVQKALFENYPGVVKSLGAWGGDFVLATGAEENRSYFENYGLTTIIPFKDLILH